MFLIKHAFYSLGLPHKGAIHNLIFPIPDIDFRAFMNEAEELARSEPSCRPQKKQFRRLQFNE